MLEWALKAWLLTGLPVSKGAFRGFIDTDILFYAGNLYWTNDAKKVIEVSRLDGTQRYVLMHEGLNKLRGIAVDPVRG